MANEVTVLITSHKRPHTLKPQLAAVLNQSVKPAKVVVWHNGSNVKPDTATMKTVSHIYCSDNWGVWPRMDFCRNFDTEYCCVLDDDCVPGRKWLELCLETHRQTGGVVGCNGVIFVDGTRANRHYVGLDGHRDAPTRVDIVGHSWFFERRDVHHYIFTGRRHHSTTCGEDYHWSFVMQTAPTYTGKPRGCFVPPRNISDSETWGSLQPRLGTDDVALYRQPGEDENKQACHDAYKAAGWRTLSEMEPK